MSEKICPIMAKGWLANKYSARTDAEMFLMKFLPPCLERKCACWVRINSLVPGHCGLIGEKNDSIRKV